MFIHGIMLCLCSFYFYFYRICFTDTIYNVKNTFVLSLSTSVDSCVPGDVVTISGMVKVNSVDEGENHRPVASH
jgi:hypothetical protein